ncbi:MAG: spermidine synthase [Zoogloeaceae bacterium]|nr:spermidine synthase [Zoogloeaceae bacterium]
MSTPIDISEHRGVRYLHFGSEWIQGAMRIRRPNDLELAYTREMMAGLLLREAPWPRSALVIGLGAGSVVKFIRHHLPNCRVQVVEIEPRVLAAARQFFALPPEDDHLAIAIADGAEYVLDHDRHFDYILVDGYDRHARAGALDTFPFYLACRQRLSDQGLLSVNLFGRSRGYHASLERLNGAFDDRMVAFPSCDSGNVVAFAAAGATVTHGLPDLRAAAQGLRIRTGLDLADTVARLAASGTLPGGMLVL